MTAPTNNYGSSSWAVGVCTSAPSTDTETGAAFDQAGTVIYIEGTKVEFDEQYLDPTLYSASAYSFDPKTGRRAQWVVITGWVLIDPNNPSDLPVQTENRVTEFFNDNQTIGAVPLYLILKRNGHAKSFYAQGTKHWYLRGYAKLMKVVDQGGGDVQITLTFKESWN